MCSTPVTAATGWRSAESARITDERCGGITIGAVTTRRPGKIQSAAASVKGVLTLSFVDRERAVHERGRLARTSEAVKLCLGVGVVANSSCRAGAGRESLLLMDAGGFTRLCWRPPKNFQRGSSILTARSAVSQRAAGRGRTPDNTQAYSKGGKSVSVNRSVGIRWG